MTDESLRGLRIIVPVTAGRHELARRLAQAGARVDEVEFIAVTAPESAERLAEATARWCDGYYDWMAVTSRNAVLALDRVARVAGARLADPQPAARVATVGEATSEVCAKVGLSVSIVPTSRHDALGIVHEFPAGSGRVLVPVGDLAAPALARGIARKGWIVDVVEAYRVMDGPGVHSSLAADLANGEVDAVLLTSGSVAERFAPHAAPPSAGTLVVAIGRSTAAAARAKGLRVDAVAQVPTYDGIVAALTEAWEGRR